MFPIFRILHIQSLEKIEKALGPISLMIWIFFIDFIMFYILDFKI